MRLQHAFLGLDEDDTAPLLPPRTGNVHGNNRLRPTSEASLDSIAYPSRAPSVFTVVSNGILSLELDEMCDYIVGHRSLQNASIVSTETYGEKMGVFVHRFVIMELRRQGKKDIWLRLERKRETHISTLNFIAASGKSHANDMVGLHISAMLLGTVRVNAILH